MQAESTVQARLESLKSLDWRKFEYVVKRAQSKGIYDALKLTEVGRGWWTKLPRADKDELEELALALKQDAAARAYLKLQAVAEKAVDVLDTLVDRRGNEASKWVWEMALDAGKVAMSYVVQKPAERSELKLPGLEKHFQEQQEIMRKVWGDDDSTGAGEDLAGNEEGGLPTEPGGTV